MRQIVIGAAALAAWVVGCGSSSNQSPAATACVAGKVEACPCSGGAQGVQTCKDDGSGFGACDCGGGGEIDAGGTEPEAGDDATTDAGADPDAADPGGYGSQSQPGLTCADIKVQVPSATDGAYWINPGSGTMQVWCDMTYTGPMDRPIRPGLTLLFRTDIVNGSFCATEQAYVGPGVSGYLKLAGAIAAVSTIVHIRSTGQANGRSMTSLPNTVPVTNLSSDWMIDHDYNASDWFGPMADAVAANMVGVDTTWMSDPLDPMSQQKREAMALPVYWRSKANSNGQPAGGLWLTPYMSGAAFQYGCAETWGVAGTPGQDKMEVYVGTSD